MKKWNPILKFLAIFLVSLIALVTLSMNENVRKMHCQYYCVVGQPLINLLNPHVYAEFEEGAIENENNWDISFRVWDKREHDERVFLKSYREKNSPRALLYQNAHELFLIPTLFLIALFFASPISIKAKLIRFPIGLAAFYIFMTLYLSYRFEFTLMKNTLPIDSIWHGIIWFFGLGGNTDPIYILVFLIWIFLMIPNMKQLKLESIFNKAL